MKAKQASQQASVDDIYNRLRGATKRHAADLKNKELTKDEKLFSVYESSNNLVRKLVNEHESK